MLKRAEFAKKCSTPEKSYTEAHIRNMEEGYADPGRELLEAAAKAAGFEFEQCIQLPVKPKVLDESAAALEIFTRALGDWRAPLAIKAALDLATIKKPRRTKYGGRTRKR